MKVQLYSNGVCLDMGTPAVEGRVSKSGKKRGGGKRKSINGSYSAASFRRMREYCITHDCEGDCWGVTLTVPGPILDNADFKSLVHKLTQFCNYWEIPCVWRCELQQRGQPHLHLVLYGCVDEVVRVMSEWQTLIYKQGTVFNVEKCGDYSDIVEVNRALVNGSCHMYDVQKLHGDFRSWRYLVAHASKGKQVQLGWAGRQWGVVCRRKMVTSSFFSIVLDDREMYALRRWVRRASSRRIGNHGRHFVLLNPDDLQRMVDYLKDDYFGAPF